MTKEEGPTARCRRCRAAIPEAGARYIRMRVVSRQWLREITTSPTEIGPFCAACVELEFNPA